MEYHSYYGIEKYTFRRKISDFGVDFHIYILFFSDILNHALVIDHSQAMLVHFIIWLVIGSAIYLNAVLFCPKHNKWGGGSFSQFWKQIDSWSCEWYEVSGKSSCFFVCLICFFTSHQQSFKFKGMGLPWLNQCVARINVSCSRTQRSDASEPRTHGPSVSSQALYHWATASANYRRPQFEIWNTTDIFIKMSIINLWCNDASWSLVLCAL